MLKYSSVEPLRISKHSTETYTQYYERIFASFHQLLWQYADKLSDTHNIIELIEIRDKQLWMKLRNKNLYVPLFPGDPGTAPLAAFNNGSYEETDSRLIYASLQYLINTFSQDITIFDVGANVGWYSLNFAYDFPHSSVYAFEPAPSAYNLLSEAITRNSLQSRISLSSTIILDTDGVSQFHVADYSGASGIIQNLTCCDYTTIEEKTLTLDTFCSLHKVVPSFIKIDVEGAELHVLKGFISTLQRLASKPIIFCELLRKWCKNQGYHPNDVIHLMNSLGYTCYHAMDSLYSITNITEETLPTNFLFLHKTHDLSSISKYYKQGRHV